MKKISDDIVAYLYKHKRFLIMVHQKPDGDAIGSAIALGRGLKSIGKDVDYYVQLPVERRLDCFDEIRCFNKLRYDHYDALVMLDCSTWDYAYKPEKLPAYDKILVVDHHMTNEGYGDYNHVENTSAAAELVYRLLVQLDITPDEEMVNAIFTGISTDTGSFQFSNVTADTHRILAELYGYKSDFAELSKRLHSEKTFDQMKMYGAAAASLKTFDNGRLGWIELSHDTIKQYGGGVNITDDISNIGVDTVGVILAVTIREVEPKTYRVSLRSKTPYPVDCAAVAKRYGGGGHLRAAGFTFTDDLSKLKDELTDHLHVSLADDEKA